MTATDKPAERRRLGRGLDALLGGSLSPSTADLQLPPEVAAPGVAAAGTAPIDRIALNPYQPRKDFDPEALEALKQSISTHGLLQPVVVRDTGDGYQLIAGERRLRAAKEVGWTEIPVHVVDLNDQAVFEAALVENVQRIRQATRNIKAFLQGDDALPEPPTQKLSKPAASR